MAWLQMISNKSLCDWFFIMFILNCVAGLIMLLRLVYVIMITRPGILFGSLTFILTIVAVAIPIVNGAFFYALCDRTLLAPVDDPKITPIRTNERNLVFGTF
jgi:hypothetical protein